MAVQIKLVRRADATATGSDISSISLLSNTNGFDLEYFDGWTQAVPQGMTPGHLTETFNLIAKGTAQVDPVVTAKDDLAAHLQALDDKLKEAEWYWDDPAERYGVWLRAQLTDETYARQALIRRGEGQPEESPYGPYVDQGNTIRRYSLGLERLPWWEDTAYTLVPGLACSCAGNAISHGTVSGDVPARVAMAELETATAAIDECWFGFRTARFGTIANFEVTWACGSGTVYANTGTTDEGTTMLCDFSDGDPDGEALQSRFYVKVSDITTDYSDQRGQFIVLMRAQLTAPNTTTRVRLFDGYASTASDLRRQDRVVINDQAWKLYSLGTVQIPPLTEWTAAYDMLRSYRLCIQAERTTGAGSLRCDRFFLIPISEGAIYLSNVNLTTVDYHGIVQTKPDGAMNGYTFSDNAHTDVVSTMAPRPQGPYSFTMPIGAGVTVFAGQRADQHVDTDTLTTSFYELQRWRTLRGADT